MTQLLLEGRSSYIGIMMLSITYCSYLSTIVRDVDGVVES